MTLKQRIRQLAMRLFEVDDEFNNVKPSSPEERLKFAEQRVNSLQHHLALRQAAAYKFKDRFLMATYQKELSPDDIQMGRVMFPYGGKLGRDGKKVMYQGLSPQEIKTVAELWQRIAKVQDALEQAQKPISRLKLEVKKANGTYISQNEINKCEFAFQHDVMQLISPMLGSGYKINNGGTRTKKNGTSRISIVIYVPPNGVTFDTTIKKILADKIKSWSQANGLTVPRVSCSIYNDNKICSVEIRGVSTAELIKKYHKK
jgi:hypothetical protein